MAKVDNHNLPAKLELRRYFLRKYHSDEPPHVLDCCQGSGIIWNRLREEFPVASYWGIDKKRKKGRLKIDSARILAQPGWNQNVIDVDTYGSPWAHWGALVPTVVRPITVFLTRGSHSTEPLDRYEKRAVGIHFLREIPRAFWPKLQLADYSIRCCVTRVCDGIIVAEAVQAVSNGNARYIGVRLEPAKNGEPELVTPARPKHPHAVKEREHV